MSPEQVRGEEVEPRSDLFALGCVLYEMMAGRAPFARGTATETIAAILCEQPPPLPHVPEPTPSTLQQLIERCLTKSRDERPQTAREVIEALQATLHAPGDAGDVGAPGDRKRAGAALAAVLVPVRGWIAAAISAAVALALLALATSPGISWRAATIDSVAVLPLMNADGDEETEYLSDGISEDLINNLSQLPQLKRVIARSTVARYKGTEIDPRKVGRELNVRAVLTGKMIQQGEDLMIQAELVNAIDGSRLWGGQYRRTTADLVGLQADITEHVSEALRLTLTGDQRERLGKRDTDNSAALRLYLKGRYALNKHSEAGWRQALEHFRQAIELDPAYAPAWAGMAEAYYQMSSLVLPPGEAIPKARAAATKALEFDATLAEARTTLAVIKAQNDWDWLEAEKEYQRALELKPSYATARAVLRHVFGPSRTVG
jgi:serine/threonine-protein kinase